MDCTDHPRSTFPRSFFIPRPPSKNCLPVTLEHHYPVTPSSFPQLREVWWLPLWPSDPLVFNWSSAAHVFSWLRCRVVHLAFVERVVPYVTEGVARYVVICGVVTYATCGIIFGFVGDVDCFCASRLLYVMSESCPSLPCAVILPLSRSLFLSLSTPSSPCLSFPVLAPVSHVLSVSV